MQQMNVNDPDTLTETNVAALLASKDDSQHRQLRVMDDGSVVLSDDIGNLNLNGVRARWETWCQGNSYCGPAAANDEKWVAGVLYDLQQVVPKNRRGFIEE